MLQFEFVDWATEKKYSCVGEEWIMSLDHAVHEAMLLDWRKSKQIPKIITAYWKVDIWLTKVLTLKNLITLNIKD
jgi:hypothetical protein